MQNKKEYTETWILQKIRTPRGLVCQVLFLKSDVYHKDLLLFNLSSYFLLGSVCVHVFFRRSPLYYIT